MSLAVYFDGSGGAYVGRETRESGKTRQHNHQVVSRVSSIKEGRQVVHSTFGVLVEDYDEFLVRQGHSGSDTEEQ